MGFRETLEIRRDLPAGELEEGHGIRFKSGKTLASSRSYSLNF
jgi:hypothetical protein